MRILIVRRGGLYRQPCCPRIPGLGHEVAVFDNFSTGSRDNLFPEERLIEGDIHDYPALYSKAMCGTDAVIHLAAAKAAGESMLKPEKYSIQNLCGSVNIINAAVEAGVASSCSPRRRPSTASPSTCRSTRSTRPSRRTTTASRNSRSSGSSPGTTGSRACATRLCDISTRPATIRTGRISGLEKNPANLIPVIMEVAAGMRPSLKVFGTDYPTKRRHRRARLRARERPRPRPRRRPRLDIARTTRVSSSTSAPRRGSPSSSSSRRRAASRARPIPAEMVGRRPGDPASSSWPPRPWPRSSSAGRRATPSSRR